MMKKIIVMMIGLMLITTGCSFKGYDWVDTNYHFNKAYISMPDGEVIEVDIKSWSDSEDGEQLTITSTDGTRYMVNSVNCILVEENEDEE